MSRTYHGEIRVALMSSDMRSLKRLRECLRECCDACHLSSRSAASLYPILGKISRATKNPAMIALERFTRYENTEKIYKCHSLSHLPAEVVHILALKKYYLRKEKKNIYIYTYLIDNEKKIIAIISHI